MKLRGIVESLSPSEGGAFAALMQSALAPILAYRLGRLARELQPIWQAYEAARVSLIRKYGVEREGGVVEVPPGKMVEFLCELDPVLDEPVPVNVVIPDVRLSDLDGVKLSPAQMMKLSWLINE